jgi:hypothetical protein
MTRIAENKFSEWAHCLNYQTVPLYLLDVKQMKVKGKPTFRSLITNLLSLITNL